MPEWHKQLLLQEIQFRMEADSQCSRSGGIAHYRAELADYHAQAVKLPLQSLAEVFGYVGNVSVHYHEVKGISAGIGSD